MSKASHVTILSLVFIVAACASPGPTSTVNVPEKLKPPANESLAMIVAAKGVQIYECRAKKDQVAIYEWAFVAPEAGLFDARGNRIGRHYAGPHWEATDGSLRRTPSRGSCSLRSPSAPKVRSAGLRASSV
jgi:hypothetical protein